MSKVLHIYNLVRVCVGGGGVSVCMSFDGL